MTHHKFQSYWALGPFLTVETERSFWARVVVLSEILLWPSHSKIGTGNSLNRFKNDDFNYISVPMGGGGGGIESTLGGFEYDGVSEKWTAGGLLNTGGLLYPFSIIVES